MENNNLNGMALSQDELEQVSGGKGGGNFVKATGNVHVRTGASKDHSILGTLSTGTVVSYLNETKRDDRNVAWYKVNYNGSIGWVSSKYAKII